MALHQPRQQKESLTPPPYAPLPNVSTFRLFDWAYTTSSITKALLDALVNNVILQDDFEPSHFHNFRAKRELQKLDALLPSDQVNVSDELKKPSLFKPKPTPRPSKTPPFEFDESVWLRGSISIPMPCVGHKHASEDDAPKLRIDDVWYRKPMSIIRSLVKDEEFLKLHLRPFKEFWIPPTRPMFSASTAKRLPRIELFVLSAKSLNVSNHRGSLMSLRP